MSMNEEIFEPKIIGFLCNWCSYRAADLAGTSRIKYQPNVRMIRVMCTGRVSSVLILKAFALGADGVLVSGCHPGQCHYEKGNMSARRRVVALKPFLDTIGIGQERLRLEWIAASEAPRVAEVIAEFTETIKQFGPSPFGRRRDEN